MRRRRPSGDVSGVHSVAAIGIRPLPVEAPNPDKLGPKRRRPMMNLIVSLVLSLPAQAPPQPDNARAGAAPRPAERRAQPRADKARPALAPQPAVAEARPRDELQATVDRRRAKAAARADKARRARAEEVAIYKAQLEYQARIAPFVAQQQQRAAEFNSRAESERAWLAIARERNLIYGYGFGAPMTAGPQGVQVYGGLPANFPGQP
jgi:hypothetical protein